MIVFMFSVRDNAIEAFQRPFYARSYGEAERMFKDAVSQEGSELAKHASDFTLHFIGEFDDGSGIVTPVEPRRIISAAEVLSVLSQRNLPM